MIIFTILEKSCHFYHIKEPQFPSVSDLKDSFIGFPLSPLFSKQFSPKAMMKNPQIFFLKHWCTSYFCTESEVVLDKSFAYQFSWFNRNASVSFFRQSVFHKLFMLKTIQEDSFFRSDDFRRLLDSFVRKYNFFFFWVFCVFYP